MPTQKITKGTVTAAAPRAVRYAIYDSVVTGFGLRVYPTGKKAWVFDYRPSPGGKSTPMKRVTIGLAAHPDPKRAPDFTPDAARAVAQKLKASVLMGNDPQGALAGERDAPTVEEVGRAFLSQHVSKKRSATTLAFYSDILERIVFPKHGTRKAKDFTGRHMSALHQALGDTPYQANRMLAVVGSMYSWAGGPVGVVPEGLNPARGIERFEEEQRGRVLSTEELERLGAAIRTAETTGIPWRQNPGATEKHRTKDEASRVTTIGPHAAAALRLLILTGMRLREVLHLRWEQVDLDQGIIVLAKHKTSRTTGKKGIVLNAPALQVLAELPRIGAYVIAGDAAGQKGEKPRADLKRPWAAVRQHAGLEDLRIHDLRHNFGGFGAGGGLGLPIIGKLLGHTQPATTARYSHLDNDPLRRASNAIGAALAAAMGEPIKDTTDNVVQLRGKVRT